MKYYIITSHGDAFAIRIEVSKRIFKRELKDNLQFAKVEEIEANADPNERGDFFKTDVIEYESATINRHIFGCGASETIFEEVVYK